MSVRSALIVASLAANLILAVKFQGAARSVKDARQLSILEDTDLNRVRELAGRVRPSTGINPSGLTQDLVILQAVKQAVSDHLSSGFRGKPDLVCPAASRGELNQMIAQMNDYKKRVDVFLAGSAKDAAAKEEMVRKVEAEAQRMKLELMALCARG